MIDRSPSMTWGMTPSSRRSKLDEVKDQVLDFCDALTSRYRNVPVRVFVFDETVSEIARTTLGDDIADLAELKSKCRSIAYAAEKRTFIWSSLKSVYEMAERELNGDDSLTHVRICVLSDGEDTQGPTAPKDFFNDKGVNSERWERLSPVFVSIGSENGQPSRIKDEMENKGIPFVPAAKPANLIPPEPILRIFPCKIQGEGDDLLYLLEEDQRALFVSLSIGNIKKTVIEIDGEKHETRELEIPFGQPGDYEVKLSVFGDNDEFGQSKSYKLRVTEKAPLQAKFSVSKSEIALGESVTFVNESVGGPERVIWELSDGTKNNARHFFPHKFTKPGKYTAKLTVYDSKGRNSSFTLPTPIEVATPVAPTAEIIAFPEKTNVGESVSLNDVSKGTVAYRQWYIDGKFVGDDERLRNVVFDETQIGTRTVKLEVKDPYGSVSTAEKKIEVMPIPKPVADFGVSTSTPQAHRSFNAYYAGRGGGPISDFRWAVDGKEVSARKDSPDSADIVIDVPGEHEITLTVIGAGGEHSKTKRVEVAPVGKPVAGFYAPENVAVDSKAQIWDHSQNADEIFYLIDGKRLEDYPDAEDSQDESTVENAPAGENGGSESELEEDVEGDNEGESTPLVLVVANDDAPASPVLIFKESREYVVEQVCRNEGGEDRFERRINATPYAPPSVGVVPPSVLTAGVPAKFVVVAAGNVQSGSIDFGEGPVPLDFSSKSDGGSLNVEVEHAFPVSGEYVVNCEVQGRGGIVKAEPTTLTVQGAAPPPVADFDVSTDKKYGEVHWRIVNNSQGTGPFTFEIQKDGATYETIKMDDRSGLERTVKGPGVFRIILTAESGSEYPPDRQEKIVKVRAHSLWFIPCLIGACLLVLVAIGAGVWIGVTFHAYALKGQLEYAPIDADNFGYWSSVRIDKLFSKQAIVYIGDGDKTDDESANQSSASVKTKVTISKSYVSEVVNYTIMINDDWGELFTFTRESFPSRSEPLELGGWKFTFSDFT
ncbi:MAG: hypothetical protein IJL92_06355 [Thermoguttaceae bacterium]|nr:hypothetical protein [Thermoguttaceae bacterium]